MADIRPFRAVRPKEGLEAKIAALPYDVYSREEAKDAVQGKPLSFLNIDRPETFFETTENIYAPKVYERAGKALQDMIEQGSLVKENEECYYLYELTMQGRTQTGIVACASIDDYLNNVIKKHENTREDKELDRIRHVDACSAQTGPIFLAYRFHQGIQNVIDGIKKCSPYFDFTAEDGIRHRGWKIEGKADKAGIQQGFHDMDRIYIADGHHRCASAVKVGLQRRKACQSYTGEEEFNYFLSVLFPDKELLILDYNRVVKSLNGHSEAEILQFLQNAGKLECVGKTPYKPKEKGEMGIYIGGRWYQYVFDKSIRSTDSVKNLDVSLLQDYILKPLFGIIDPKTDNRIDFVGGIRGLEELERRVEKDCKMAFAMYETSIYELFAVADDNLLMPPKSTWFEPKLRSGLFIHEIER